MFLSLEVLQWSGKTSGLRVEKFELKFKSGSYECHVNLECCLTFLKDIFQC